MKTFISFLLCFVLAKPSYQCGNGVLSCIKSGDTTLIRVCDFFNSFKLNIDSKQCEKKDVPNCLNHPVKNTGLICSKCNPGYAVNQDNTECVQVPEESKKDNCEEYQNQTFSCSKCKEDFFIFNGECIPLNDNKILNCVTYSSLGVCSECIPGMYLSNNVCKTISEIKNCYLHSNRKCLQCKDGYYVSESSNPSINVDTSSFDFLVENNMIYAYWSNSLADYSCQKGNIANCVVYTNSKECEKCEEDYYVNLNKFCSRNQEEQIANCSVYTNLTTCTKCEFEYYLSGNQCNPVDKVDLCAEYNISQNSCVACEDRYYLDGSKKCSNERVNSLSVSNCKTKDPSRDVCKDCEEGYSKSTNEVKCLKNIDNCVQTVPSNGSVDYHTCSRCETGYYISQDSKSCEQNTIAECEVLTEQQNECTRCKTGFYYDAIGASCEKQNLEFCEIYTTNKNECTKCSSLYYVDGIRCLPIIDQSNCYESDGINNKCVKCKPLFFTDGTRCPSTNTRLIEVIDTQCKFNSETELNSKCSECNEGYFLVEGTSKAIADSFFNDNNCFKIDSDNGKCIQCVENSSGSINGTEKTCSPPDSNLTTDCLQLMENSFETLDKNNCSKCRNPLLMFLNPNNNLCQSRTDPTINQNCEIYPLFEDAPCTSCKNGFFPLFTEELKDQCVLEGQITSFATISNCQIYIKNTGECLVCKNDYELSFDKKSCSSATNKMNLFLDARMSFMSPPSNFDLVENCSIYHQVDLNLIKCSVCSTNYVNIMKRDKTIYIGDYNAGGFNVGLGALVPFVEACVLNTDSFKTADGTFINSPKKCEIGVQVESREGYGCIRCKTGFNGNIQQATHDKNGNILDTPINVVGPCVSDTSITNAYYGVGYHLNKFTDKFPLAPYFNYSNCQISTRQIYFNSLVKDGGEVELIQTKTTNPVNLFFCSLDNTNNTLSFKDRCQIFAFRTAPDPNFDTSNPPVDICVACKSGYRAIISETTRQITDCVEIPACEKSSENYWMNACENANFGYKLNTVENNELIMFDQPLESAGSISSCRVYSNDLSKCVVCLEGFSLVNEICVDASTNVAYNCQTKGAGLSGLQIDGASNSNQRFMNYLFYLTFKNRYDEFKASLCSVCSSGYQLAVDTDTTSPKCLPIDNAQEKDKIEGCLNYSLSIPIRCTVCNSNLYVLNIETGHCDPISNFSDCKEIGYPADGSSTVLECLTCQDGSDLNAEKKCISKNCEKFFEEKCSLCKPGFIIEEGNENLCIESTSVTYDPCEKYSPINKTCGKCKDSKALFVYYENDGSNLNLKGFSCENGSVPPGFISGWNGYNLDEMFIVSTYNSILKTVSNSLDFIISDELSKKIYSSDDPNKSPAVQHCFLNRTIDNCVTENLVGGSYCTKCQNGYYIDKDKNTCVLGSISFCDIYEDDSKCEKCLESYYLSSSSTCTPYSSNLNCKEFKLTENKCENCPENYFLNSSSICEQYRSDLNCKEYAQGENKCTSCNDDYWFNVSLRSCEKRTTVGCKTNNTNANSCIDCQDNYFKTTSGQVLCTLQDTVEFCESYFTDKKGCQKCDDEHYLDSENNKCQPKPDGISNCLEYNDTDFCKTCASGYVLSQNSCTEVVNLVSNCENYSADGVCSKCKEDFFLNKTSFTCESVNVNNCLEFLSVDTCKKCKANFILKYANNKLDCEYSSISGCLVAIGGTFNTCKKCEIGKGLSADKRSCSTPSKSISNCLEYQTTETCKVCSENYIRSEDWKSCTSLNSSTNNCSNAIIDLEPICQQCKSGFQRDSTGTCSKCGDEGCLVCGAKVDECLMCGNGYFMTTEAKCQKTNDGLAVFQE